MITTTNMKLGQDTDNIMGDDKFEVTEGKKKHGTKGRLSVKGRKESGRQYSNHLFIHLAACTPFNNKFFLQ